MAVRQHFKSFFDEFTFGQYLHKDTGKGEIFTDVLDENPGYVDWCIENDVLTVDPSLKDRVNAALEKWAEGRPGK